MIYAMLAVWLLLAIAGLVWSRRIEQRISKVTALYKVVNQMCYNWAMRHDADVSIPEQDPWSWAWKQLPSYGKVLYSFRPLTLESVVPKDILDRLNT